MMDSIIKLKLWVSIVDDIEAALKMVMHQKQLDQQEEMRKRDLQKRNYLNNIYGMSQTNNLRGGN